VLALVFFRAGSVEQALIVFRGLAAATGPLFPSTGGLFLNSDIALVFLGLAIIWFLPNALQWVGGFEAQGFGAKGSEAPSRTKEMGWSWITAWRPLRWKWSPSLGHGAFVGVLTCFALIRVFGVVPSQFLYFTF